MKSWEQRQLLPNRFLDQRLRLFRIEGRNQEYTLALYKGYRSNRHNDYPRNFTTVGFGDSVEAIEALARPPKRRLRGLPSA